MKMGFFIIILIFKKVDLAKFLFINLATLLFLDLTKFYF